MTTVINGVASGEFQSVVQQRLVHTLIDQFSTNVTTDFTHFADPPADPPNNIYPNGVGFLCEKPIPIDRLFKWMIAARGNFPRIFVSPEMPPNNQTLLIIASFKKESTITTTGSVDSSKLVHAFSKLPKVPSKSVQSTIESLFVGLQSLVAYQGVDIDLALAKADDHFAYVLSCTKWSSLDLIKLDDLCQSNKVTLGVLQKLHPEDKHIGTPVSMLKLFIPVPPEEEKKKRGRFF